jgi:rhamnosyl/mannosyltransferase
MKILQVNKHYAPWVGGIETVVQDIAEGLKGHQMRVLVSQTETGKDTEKEIVNGVEVYRARMLCKIQSMPVSFDFLKLFKELSADSDIIIIHHPFPLAFLAAVLYGKDKKIIVWYHSDIVRQKILNFFVQPIIKKVLKQSSKIFVLGENIVKYSRLLEPFKNKCVVVPFGIDLSRFNNPKDLEEAQLIKNKYSQRIILTVGRLVYYKGFQILIDAMSGVDAKLIIIGDGPLREELQTQIAQENLQNNIEIIPYVKSLVPFMQASVFFVLPSVARSEAFGIVQLEAMACGKPVINTALQSAVPEVSQNGLTGITVDPSNSKVLKEAINTLLNNKELLNRYGLAAKERVQTFYSKEKFVKTIEENL